MSKNYLDKTGLARLWEKITSSIATKQNKITYGSAEPTGGEDGDIYLMTEPNDAVDKVGDLSTLTTDDQSSVVAAINELNNRVVFETTLTANTTTIEATGLDMVADGGEYEFELYHAEETTADLHITFNDITTGYYQAGLYYNNSLTANGTLTTTSFFRPNMTRIYYGTGGTTTISFPAVMKGRFLFSNNTRKTVNYELKNTVTISGNQAIVDLYGVNSNAVENLTSIKFIKYDNTNFLAGTRLIIKKVN